MSEVQARLTAALADRYRIERELGQGGMATVYLAQDLKHDRKVALKVLKPELAAVLGADRFVQEIKTTAALQHPAILPLFDSGVAEGFLYYVMPFIDGETLRSKLDRETQLGIEDAVRTTTAVADALDYAHRHGVIHRDIKPENILLHDGRPVVADFEIALAVSAAAGGRMTETGLSLGTPHYMSPEQATAEKDLSNRSDIYSLGCVLYEMLTGSPPHVGASAQQIIMKIVTEDVAPVSRLRKAVPPNVADAVAKSVEKLPADRFETAKAFGEALNNPGYVGSGPARARQPGAAPRGGPALAGWIVAGVLAVVLGWSVLRRPTPAPSPVTRFALSMGSPDGAKMTLDVSPDGQHILALRTAAGGHGGLLVRDLSSLAPRSLGNSSGEAPRFSPDGRWIAYSPESGVLEKVPSDGGTPTHVGDCERPEWIDATMLLCVTPAWGLGRISSAGGPVEVLTVPDTAQGEIAQWSAQVLPGGQSVLYTSYRRPLSRIEGYDFRTRKHTVLVENAFMARYARSGHLLYQRGDALFAIRFDPATMQTRGDGVPMVEDVASSATDAEGGFAISDNGTLIAIRKSEWSIPSTLVWVDRRGAEQPVIDQPGVYANPSLSPDGSKLVIAVKSEFMHLWVYDFRRGALTQLSHGPATEYRPVWTPDGREVVFTHESPAYDLYRLAIDGSTPARPIVEDRADKFPTSISPNGTIAFHIENFGRNGTRLIPLNGGGVAKDFGDAGSTADDAAFSPDGAWIASTERSGPGPANVFVRRVDGSGGKVQISVNGGEQPHWTKVGREIVFLNGNAMNAVDVDAPRGVVGSPRVLFTGSYNYVRRYDVTPDGSRFIVVKPHPRPEALPVLVITNFFEELNAKVPQ